MVYTVTLNPALDYVMRCDYVGSEDINRAKSAEILLGGKGINDPALVNTLVSNTADAIDWLASQDIKLTDVASFGGASVKRIHRPRIKCLLPFLPSGICPHTANPCEGRFSRP